MPEKLLFLLPVKRDTKIELKSCKIICHTRKMCYAMKKIFFIVIKIILIYSNWDLTCVCNIVVGVHARIIQNSVKQINHHHRNRHPSVYYSALEFCSKFLASSCCYHRMRKKSLPPRALTRLFPAVFSIELAL